MKLRNKKTGKVIEWFNNTDGVFPNTLAELNEEWEDYEEPKEFWYITGNGYVDEDHEDTKYFADDLKFIGNYFETEEEAEKAVEKLKAWKRLKEQGFKFDGYTMFKRSGFGDYDYSPNIDFIIPELDKDEPSGYPCDIIKDLELLFGGEE